MLPPFRKAALSPPKEGFSVSRRTALIESPDGVQRAPALRNGIPGEEERDFYIIQ
jgi:hypothetical protein